MDCFVQEMRVRIYDTDAAGILYFANQFRFVQNAFEAFFDSIGYPIPDMIENQDYILPVVHAECDYSKSLKAGMLIRVAVQVEALKTSSITLAFKIVDDDNIEYGRARIVYVFVSNDDMRKRPIPQRIRNILKRFLVVA